MHRTKAAEFFRLLLVPQLCALLWLIGWVFFAHVQGLPFSTVAFDPLSAVETSLQEVQQHPEEGIHALARLHLPPYTGILHTSALLLWALALGNCLRRPACDGMPNGKDGTLGIDETRGRHHRSHPVSGFRFVALLFTLAMLQDTLFLTSWRSGHESLFDALYFVLLAAAIAPTLRQLTPLSGAQLACLFGWLVLRKFADDLVQSPASDLTERLADLQLPALWIVYQNSTKKLTAG